MESKKNTPPKGVLVAVGVIVALVVFYLILTMAFPDIFERLNTGRATPVTK